MADLHDLKRSANFAVEACDSAPFMVRPYLKPLVCFIRQTVKAIDEINAAGGCPGNCKKET